MGLEEKIRQRLDRLDEVEALLSTEQVARNVKEFKKLSAEHARLSQLKQTQDILSASKTGIQDSQQLLEIETDPEMRQMLKDEIDRLALVLPQLEKELIQLLVPPDPDDHRNVILELRAGTGGEEAADLSLIVFACIECMLILRAGAFRPCLFPRLTWVDSKRPFSQSKGRMFSSI